MLRGGCGGGGELGGIAVLLFFHRRLEVVAHGVQWGKSVINLHTMRRSVQ